MLFQSMKAGKLFAASDQTSNYNGQQKTELHFR